MARVANTINGFRHIESIKMAFHSKIQLMRSGMVQSDVESCYKTSRALRGTTINSVMGERGSVRGMTKRPSLAMVATLRYRFTSLMLLAFLKGRVPCFKWAWVRRTSEHSA